LRRHRQAEALAEGADVVAVVILRFIAAVVKELELGSEAADVLSRDHARARETRRGVDGVAAVRAGARLEAVAFVIEGDRMEVDPVVARVGDDEARGAFVEVDGEAERGECGEHTLDRRELHHHVEVGVLAGLLTEEGVDAPAAVEPIVEAGSKEPAHNFDYVIRGHHGVDPVRVKP
jgi:hypothetical protein